jgi:hypothetical protein
MFLSQLTLNLAYLQVKLSEYFLMFHSLSHFYYYFQNISKLLMSYCKSLPINTIYHVDNSTRIWIVHFPIFSKLINYSPN